MFPAVGNEKAMKFARTSLQHKGGGGREKQEGMERGEVGRAGKERSAIPKTKASISEYRRNSLFL